MNTSQLRKSYTVWDKKKLLYYIKACMCGSMWREQMKDLEFKMTSTSLKH